MPPCVDDLARCLALQSLNDPTFVGPFACVLSLIALSLIAAIAWNNSGCLAFSQMASIAWAALACKMAWAENGVLGLQGVCLAWCAWASASRQGVPAHAMDVAVSDSDDLVELAMI